MEMEGIILFTNSDYLLKDNYFFVEQLSSEITGIWCLPLKELVPLQGVIKSQMNGVLSI